MSRLRAGAARTVITPRLGSHIAGYYVDRIAVDVHDDLHAKALVLESGDTALAIVLCDLIAIPRSHADRAKRRAEELTGISVENILIAATHTHYGPALEGGLMVPAEEEYVAWYPEAVADAVKLAQARLRPAMIGQGSGSCPEEVFNRRYFMKDGSVVTNPGRHNPNVVRPAGPTDPEVGTLVVLDEGWRPIALVANYALHYVGGPSSIDDIISPDYFGAFDRAIQRIAGQECVGILLNGCCGDVNNIDVFGPERPCPYPHYHVDRIADLVAGEVLRTWKSMQQFQSEPRLAVANDFFKFERRKVTEEQVARARARLAKAAAEGNREAAYATSADPEWLIATMVAELAEAPPACETQIQVMRIGELGLVSLPGEIFVEIGLEIKQRSPFPRTIVAELGNDCLGYIPTAKAFEEGSYEAYTSHASKGTGAAMITSALALLNRVAG